MRLKEADRNGILAAIQTELQGMLQGRQAKVFLYGSRVRDDLVGGDIDLLIEVPTARDCERVMARLHYITALIKSLIGDQRIDLSVKDTASRVSDPFWNEAFQGAILLGSIH